MYKVTYFLLFLFPLFGQMTISGSVTNSDGNFLPGANIVLKGTSLGTVSDDNGMFKMEIPKWNDLMDEGELIVTYIGYIDHVSKMSEDISFYDIVLKKDALNLTKVIVTGRGTISREALGVKVGIISSNEIINSGESNVISSLSGKESGIEITSTSGEPGSSTYIRIRGANTIQSSQQPLIVIDGSPIDNSTFGNSLGRYGAGQGATSTNRAMDINPYDIKSVEVLKGPAAASIYGTKAKNGVILIKTKSGSMGENRITYRYSVSNDRVTQQPELNTKFGMGIYGDAYCEYGYCKDFWGSWGPLLSSLSESDSINGLPIMADTLDAYYRNGQIFDHTSDIFTDGEKRENSVTITGGDKSTTYYLNFSNMDHSGFFKGPNNYYNRQSIRLNVNQNVNEKLSVSGKMFFSVTDGSFIQMGSNVSGLLLGSYRTPPNFDNSVYLDPLTGYHRSYRNSNPDALTEGHGYDNPFYVLNEQNNLTNVNRFIGNIESIYTINENVNFLYRYGTDFSNDNRRYIFPPSSSENPFGLIDIQSLSTKLVDHIFQINAKKDFGWLFSNVTIGQNLNGSDYSRLGIVGENMSTYSFHQLDNTTDYTPDEYQEQIRTSSTYFNLTLGMNNAFLTLGMNRDGSSTFGKGNRFFNFPRASFSWLFTERFMIPSINKGIIRAAWGKAGSEPSAYMTRNVYVISSYSDGWGPELTSNYNGFGGFVSGTTLANPDIKPEVVSELEYGIDLTLMNEKINLGLTSYIQKTEDAILEFPVAPSTGFAYELKNAATIENNGIEISIDADFLETKTQLYSVELNYSHNINKVTNLAGSDNISLGGFAGAAAYAVEGEAYGVLRGNDWLYDSNGNYDLDENGFPQMNPEQTIIGNPNPDWLGNIRFSWNYKSTFRLSALFDIKQGGDMWNGTKGALYFFGAHKETAIRTQVPCYETTSGLKTYYETWYGEDVGSLPDIIDNGDGTLTFRGYIANFGDGPVAVTEDAYHDGPFSGFTGPASQFIEDGSYVKLREISLSYLYNADIIKVFGIQSLDFALTLRNIKTWTNYSGIDPETNLAGTSNVRGLDYFGNPQARSILFTITVNI